MGMIRSFQVMIRLSSLTSLSVLSNVQKITSAIFLLQFMFRSIAKKLTKEPCKDVVFILMCSMYFIT